MENQRAIAAITISLIILVAYQYFFVPPIQQPEINAPDQETTAEQHQDSSAAIDPTILATQAPQSNSSDIANEAVSGRDINIYTNLYQAVISENGGTIKSFKLNEFKEKLEENSPPKELITAESTSDLPLHFNWGRGAGSNVSLFKADKESLETREGKNAVLAMHSSQPSVEITKHMEFSDSSYIVNMNITVRNTSETPLQGAPFLSLANKPFDPTKSNQFLFQGPAVYSNGELNEINPDDIEEAPQTLSGTISWLAYEDTYFMCSILPDANIDNSVTLNLKNDNTVVSTLTAPQDILPVGGEKTYQYKLYFGPKELKTLKTVGQDLEKIINFGWFDIIAKPALHLLNFFHRYFNNYGVAIILVTILFKLIFWPISHKGMKSMKTMQKVQPKMAKLREKFKDDKDRLNQEMITLYKTYKINPLGGCLPMVLQIPVFFALYKVLLQTIELRHAPFMLWITDLSAPDRLFIGFDLPFLGGIPVLTLLMGGSMFLQQKMTPTAADPTQAKIMMFLPVVFTFMFLNFASGLVLYWFINNLLSIGQQYMINRSVDA